RDRRPGATWPWGWPRRSASGPSDRRLVERVTLRRLYTDRERAQRHLISAELAPNHGKGKGPVAPLGAFERRPRLLGRQRAQAVDGGLLLVVLYLSVCLKSADDDPGALGHSLLGL